MANDTDKRRAGRAEPQALVDSVIGLRRQGSLPDSCILWPFGLANGYAHFALDGKSVRVHRHVLLAVCEPPAGGLMAAHGPCHERRCINPLHLSWKTAAENAADRIRDGSAAYGQRNGSSKLTVKQVKRIRSLADAGKTYTQISKSFSVHESTIRRVAHGQLWPHLK